MVGCSRHLEAREVEAIKVERVWQLMANASVLVGGNPEWCFARRV